MIKLVYSLLFIVYRKTPIDYKPQAKRTNNQLGEILVIVIAALGVVLFTVLFIIAGSQLYFQNASYSVDAEKATALAEAGIDKTINSLNKTGGSYSGESETTLGDGSYSVTITAKDAANKLIESTGYIPNKNKARVKRTIKITASRGVGTSFIYGVQVGEGGLQLGNNNEIQGSIYSNGSITAGNNNTITGDAWVAGGPQGSPDQATDCLTCVDFIFGKTYNAETRLDVAMSFKPSATNVLNRISLKLKKFGNPLNVTVRIMEDRNGSPDKNNVLTSGTLYSSLVTGSYGWIDIAFSSSPSLSANTTYWIMIDTTSDDDDYWSWQNDLAQIYNQGSPKWSPNWSAGNPSWNPIIGGGDLSFKTIMGGAVTTLVGGSNDVVGGDAHANTIQNFAIQKDAYYQAIVNSTVAGTSHPASPDPPPKIFPISDANVTEWQQNALINGGESVGDITNCVNILESKKYVGNVTFDNHCTIIVKSPIWITGNLTLNNTNILILDSSYGATSGVIVVDGQVTLGNSNELRGTGQGSSILMVLSNYDSRTNGISAIKVVNTANTGVFYASKGIIEPGNSNTYKELTAWQIKLTNNAIINYETGLSSTIFTSGPSGTYTLVEGTYQVK